jgi:hypothetical protein
MTARLFTVVAMLVAGYRADAAAENATSFDVAKSWLLASRANNFDALVASTALPFTQKTAGVKKKCEGTAKDADSLKRWAACLRTKKDLLLSELNAGDDVDVEPYRGPLTKAMKELEKGMGDGVRVWAFLNGDGVTSRCPSWWSFPPRV